MVDVTDTGMAGFQNILLIQLGDIGDVVLTTPTICAVKETYPEAAVSILVRKPCGGLLVADPHLDEVVELEKVRGALWQVLRESLRFVRRLRRARYDLVVDLRTGDRGAILAGLTGARQRVGRNCPAKQFWHDLLFSRIVRDPPRGPPSLHPGVDQSLRVVRALGMDTGNSMPKLYVAPSDRQSAAALLGSCGLADGGCWITINPFARWKYKEWAHEKWGRVIDRLWEAQEIRAVLVGSAEESPAAARIVAGREGRAVNLAGRTTLGEMAAVLATSRLHLGVDSAPPHIAAAVGTPTLTIHGPTDWRLWRLVTERHRVVSLDLPCLPCCHMGCEDTGRSRCLDELAVETVQAVATEMLGALGVRGNSFDGPVSEC